MYISVDVGHKESGGNGNVNLGGRTTEMFSMIVTDIGNHRP